MDINGRTIWQIAAGDTDRDYAHLFIKWDVVLNGPGYAGPWPECKEILAVDGWSSKKITDLKRFAEDVQHGDLVVLRLGTSSVLAVGEVVGEYLAHEEFGDVDGWVIQHVRRVRWLWDSLDEPETFPTYTLKQGDTTQRIDSPVINGWLSKLNIAPSKMGRDLVPLPSISSDNVLGLDEISRYLFDCGVASDSIGKLLDDIGELIRIASWYQRTSMPSEHETVAYLVVPLLRALGWTPQRMAVEWNRVDVALFDRLPREDSNLAVVVEAKKMDASCLSAKSQAQYYAQGKEGCKRLIVTDGLRYGVYLRDEKNEFQLAAYMNLTRLRRTYPIYPCHGAGEALLAMAPEWDGGTATWPDLQ